MNDSFELVRGSGNVFRDIHEVEMSIEVRPRAQQGALDGAFVSSHR